MATIVCIACILGTLTKLIILITKTVDRLSNFRPTEYTCHNEQCTQTSGSKPALFTQEMRLLFVDWLVV